MVYYLDGRNVSVVLQGNRTNHILSPLELRTYEFTLKDSWPVMLCLPCSEEEDRDLSCVVSSLVQLMLDPHYRSLAGFQSLVQKEWVMAGHRFLDRCNHLKKNDKEEVLIRRGEHTSPNKLICLDINLALFVVVALVPAVPALPGLRVAVDEPVSCCVWVHRDLPDHTEWQHVDPSL